MTDKQKATQENRGFPFDATCCAEMFERMTAQDEKGCDCAGLMSQMMSTCCGEQDRKTEETTTTEASQKA